MSRECSKQRFSKNNLEDLNTIVPFDSFIWQLLASWGTVFNERCFQERQKWLLMCVLEQEGMLSNEWSKRENESL